MSRSFHTTRKDVGREEDHRYSSDSTRVDNINKLKAELEKKHTTKWQTKSLRNDNISLPITPIDAIPIEIKDSSKYLHYPAGPADIIGLLKRMPQGIVDGLSKITLCLGRPYEHKRDDFGSDEFTPDFDPFLGREGNCVFDGVYRGSTFGIYYLRKSEIRLFGYVYDANLKNRRMWEVYFRLRMLMTFVHEIGHHYDLSFRIARGKWRFDDDDKIEIYAEHMQHEWVREYVIPYLKETYPQEIEQLNAWMAENIGFVCPLEMLAGDPRARAKNGAIRVSSLFCTPSAFERFVDGLLKGKDEDEVRLEFADELHMAEEYNMALQIIASLLKQQPEWSKALLLKAEIYGHIEKYGEEIQLAQQVLTREPESLRALDIMADGYEGLKEWEKVLALCERIMELCGKEDPAQYAFALSQWVRANMERGDYDAASEGIDQLMRRDKFCQRRGKQLLAEYEKRRNS